MLVMMGHLLEYWCLRTMGKLKRGPFSGFQAIFCIDDLYSLTTRAGLSQETTIIMSIKMVRATDI